MRKASLAALVLAFSQGTQAADISVIAVSQSRAPISDAVVALTPVDGVLPPADPTHHAVMIQEHQQFAPFVLPVRVGTVVEFPNRDSFRHHVYSFSAAKTFELKLYGGGETQSVKFDTPGSVALGCNIHDNMLAYVYVVDSPYFAKTQANGRAVIANMPPGEYTVSAWHPNQKADAVGAERRVTVEAETGTELALTIEMKRDRRPRQSGAFDEKSY